MIHGSSRLTHGAEGVTLPRRVASAGDRGPATYAERTKRLASADLEALRALSSQTYWGREGARDFAHFLADSAPATVEPLRVHGARSPILVDGSGEGGRGVLEQLWAEPSGLPDRQRKHTLLQLDGRGAHRSAVKLAAQRRAQKLVDAIQAGSALKAFWTGADGVGRDRLADGMDGTVSDAEVLGGIGPRTIVRLRTNQVPAVEHLWPLKGACMQIAAARLFPAWRG